MDQPVPPPPAPEAASASRPAKQPGAFPVTVILIAPELFAGNAQEIREALRGVPKGARVLFRIENKEQLALAESVASTGLPSEWLLGPSAPAPAAPHAFARMPESSNPQDTDAMGLALSDILIVPAAKRDEAGIVRRATALRKQMVKRGPEIDTARPESDPGRRLDPDDPWNYFLWGLTGRLDPFLLECLAFRRQSQPRRDEPRQDGSPRTYAKSWKNVIMCFGRKIRLEADFAGAGWTGSAPDGAAVSPQDPIVAAFDRFDRRAVFGAALHRDAIWLLHLSAAAAVIFAVLGAVLRGLSSHASEHAVGIDLLQVAEFFALVIVIGCVWLLRRSGLQEHWQTCRFAAEHLRIARMCLPLMALPEALRIPDGLTRSTSKDGDVIQAAVEVLKRAVRDQGLPCRSKGESEVLSQATPWLKTIISYQRRYHEGNYEKLKKAEDRIVLVATLIFLLALYALVVHVVFHMSHGEGKWPFLLAAIGPGFVTAFYGTDRNLSVVSRIVRSTGIFLITTSLFSVVFYIFSHLSDQHTTWSLLFTAGAPALAAALHGTGTRLGIVHRAALSEETAAALAGIEAKLEAWENTPRNGSSPSSSDCWRKAHELALDAAAALSFENKSWHNLVRLQHDVFPA